MVIIVKKEGEERIPTGIPGFDRLCEGGLIKDSIVLVTGNAGAGKTTFLLQFLYNGATKYNENGLYISFEPETADIYRTGKRQGMDFEKLEREGKCRILKIDPETRTKEIQEKVTKIILKDNIKRICFDPINVFSISLPKEITIRKQIYDFLSLLKKIGICVLIAGETDGQIEERPEIADEIIFCKYLSDGVIELFSSGMSGVGDRALRVTKMRMTKHYRGPISFEINDKGIKVGEK
jgi:circadian clock protein KaiC